MPRRGFLLGKEAITTCEKFQRNLGFVGLYILNLLLAHSIERVRLTRLSPRPGALWTLVRQTMTVFFCELDVENHSIIFRETFISYQN